MTPSQVTRTIELCLQTRRPLCLIGKPGIGKSALPREVCQRRGLHLVDWRLSQMDSVDGRGLPMVLKVERPDGTETTEHSRYETRWIPPASLPQDQDSEGILFLDELNAALPAVQTIAYQLTHDRRIGEYVLPPKWLVMAAGNRVQDRAVVNRLASAAVNRFLMVQVEVSANDWSQWAIRQGIEPEIISCVRSQPMLLDNFEPAKWDGISNFASPRTWEYLDQTIKACPSVFGLGKSVDNTTTASQGMACWELELIQGIIGPAAGMAFFLHLQHYINLPTPAEIIADPDGAMVPDNASAKHCVSAALIRSIDRKTFGPILQYLQRLELEFQYYVAMSAIVNGGNSLVGHPAWTSFVQRNRGLFGLS